MSKIIKQDFIGSDLKETAEKGNAEAKYKTAEMYERGEGVEQNFKEAVKWYEDAGSSGYVTGWSQAGRIYFHGEEGFPKDWKKSIECFTKATEYDNSKIKGKEILNHYVGGVEDAAPFYYLGCMYFSDIGEVNEILKLNNEKARSYLETAVSYGLFAALEYLDYLYETNKINNGKYKSVSDWYTGEKVDGKAANQLAYVYLSDDNFYSDTTDWIKQILSLLPKETRLLKVLDEKEDGFEKGIFWHEISAEANHISSFYQLVYLHYYNKYYELKRPPSARTIERLVNKFFPIDKKSKNIVFGIKDCNELIYKFMELSVFSRREGLLSLDSKIKKEKNFFIKTGLKLVFDGTDYDIIKTILEFMLETDKKEGIDKIARKIIAQGIYSVQSADDHETIRMKLLELFEDKFFDLEDVWKKNCSKSEIYNYYFTRGMIFYNQKKSDAAIADFQTATELAEDADKKAKCRRAIGDVYADIQREQTLDERFAHYTPMIEILKSEPSKPILKIIKLETKEEVTELAAALALFEEYEILERLINESSSLFSADCSVLNYHVRQQFAYWGPTPLYFITTKKVLKKMKEPKKMFKFLIDNGADVNAAAADGSIPLMNQTCNDCESEEILEMLLKFGADPNKKSLFNNSETEWTPLIHCMIPIYIENENTDEESNDNMPFNNLAVKQAKLLLEYGADPNLTSRDFTELPPLIMAIRCGFITENGPNKGESPCGIIELIELLIKKGANVNFTDSDGNTPLSLAQINNLTEVVKLLNA